MYVKTLNKKDYYGFKWTILRIILNFFEVKKTQSVLVSGYIGPNIQ